jgi:hypothetical protein
LVQNLLITLRKNQKDINIIKLVLYNFDYIIFKYFKGYI